MLAGGNRPYLTDPREAFPPEILQLVSADEPSARARLIESAYQELRRIAGGQMARECDNHTLSATALANEAFPMPRLLMHWKSQSPL